MSFVGSLYEVYFSTIQLEYPINLELNTPDLSPNPPSPPNTLSPQIYIIIFYTVGLLIGMMICLEIGRRIGNWGKSSKPNKKPIGSSTIENAVFALFGLIIAFTFSGAASRFEARRHLVVEEANNLGTSWSRIDLLPTSSQPSIRKNFQLYLDKRLEAYSQLPDIEASKKTLRESEQLQNLIWKDAHAACQEKQDPATTSLVLESLNNVFDIATTRTAATQIHPPLIIYQFLFILGLSSALLAGCGMSENKKRSWLHIIAFALIISASVYVTLELEFPRLGFIQVDGADFLLLELQKTINTSQ